MLEPGLVGRRPVGVIMGYVQVELTEDIRAAISRHIAEGQAVSEADFVAQAVRLYADHLDAKNRVAGMVRRAGANVAAGHYATVSTPAETEAQHQRTMDRLRANLAAG